jgi:hypothetical protein
VLRYGEELTTLLDDEYGKVLPARVRLSLAAGGLWQRVRQSGLVGDAVPPAEGVRAGSLLVLAAWTVFAIAGASFAKFSEHFDQALPHAAGAHRLPDVAFTVLQVASGVAGIVVVTGGLLAIPSFVRLMRAGGWPSVRAHVLRALACTSLTAVVTVPLLLWAHHLTSHQRNGGLHWYGALFLTWSALVVATLILWTVVGIAAGRRVLLSNVILSVEAALAAAVAVAMAVMLGATLVWWDVMSRTAPSYLGGTPAGLPGSGWDIWIAGTVALMAIAVCMATAGLMREVRMLRRLRLD